MKFEQIKERALALGATVNPYQIDAGFVISLKGEEKGIHCKTLEECELYLNLSKLSLLQLLLYKKIIEIRLSNVNLKMDKLIRKLLIRTKTGKIVSGFEIRFWIDISFLYWKPIVELHGDMPHVFWLFFRSSFEIRYLRSTHKWNNNFTADSGIAK